MTSETIVPQLHREGQHLRRAVEARARAALDRHEATLALERVRYGLEARLQLDPRGQPRIAHGGADRADTDELRAAARERMAWEVALEIGLRGAPPIVAAIAHEERALADARAVWLFPVLGGLLGAAALAEVAWGTEAEAARALAEHLDRRRAAIARARAILSRAPESAWALAALVEETARDGGAPAAVVARARARARAAAREGAGAALAAAFSAATAGAR